MFMAQTQAVGAPFHKLARRALHCEQIRRMVDFP